MKNLSGKRLLELHFTTETVSNDDPVLFGQKFFKKWPTDIPFCSKILTADFPTSGNRYPAL